MLNAFIVLAGIAMIVIVLWEAFETIVLPRRVTRHFRMTRAFYRLTWRPLAVLATRSKQKKRRDSILSFFGPISLLLLIACWAAVLILGFALVHFGGHSAMAGLLLPGRFGNSLYLSGTTLFTLGLGDITPSSPLSRFITVLEAGIGFGFLALVIGYFPVIYQAFSRREASISLLDARAGSPPTASELLRRHTGPHGNEALTELLADWERWAADLMESHLSYPVLAYFRSQHDNQSWLASLTAVLDVCALVMVGMEGMCQYQARMTFAIARHALVDLSQVFGAPPVALNSFDRLPPAEAANFRQRLRDLGYFLEEGPLAEAELERLRSLYEPYALAMARYLCLDLPPWIRQSAAKDNWTTSAWQRKQTAAGVLDDVH